MRGGDRFGLGGSGRGLHSGCIQPSFLLYTFMACQAGGPVLADLADATNNKDTGR